MGMEPNYNVIFNPRGCGVHSGTAQEKALNHDEIRFAHLGPRARRPKSRPALRVRTRRFQAWGAVPGRRLSFQRSAARRINRSARSLHTNLGIRKQRMNGFLGAFSG